MKKEMKEMQEWIDDEGLSPCPYCGETANPLDDLGRERWDAVRISHTVRRMAWAEILPEDQQYIEQFTVRCGLCNAAGGARTSLESAREAWNLRAEPGKPTYCDKIKFEQREALARLPGLLAGL